MHFYKSVERIRRQFVDKSATYNRKRSLTLRTHTKWVEGAWLISRTQKHSRIIATAAYMVFNSTPYRILICT